MLSGASVVYSDLHHFRVYCNKNQGLPNDKIREGGIQSCVLFKLMVEMKEENVRDCSLGAFGVQTGQFIFSCARNL